MPVLILILALLLSLPAPAQQPHVYTCRFTITKPVSNNQVVDIRFTQATDPDLKPVTHALVSGTGRKYFYTTEAKGGIYIRDAKSINKSGVKTYSLVLHAWDPTRLTAINNITIYVK